MGRNLDSRPDEDQERADRWNENEQRKPAALVDRLEQHNRDAEQRKERNPRRVEATAATEDVEGSCNEERLDKIAAERMGVAPGRGRAAAERLKRKPTDAA